MSPITLKDGSAWHYHPTRWLHGGVRGLVGSKWAHYPANDANGHIRPAEYGPMPWRLDGEPLDKAELQMIRDAMAGAPRPEETK